MVGFGRISRGVSWGLNRFERVCEVGFGGEWEVGFGRISRGVIGGVWPLAKVCLGLCFLHGRERWSSEGCEMK